MVSRQHCGSGVGEEPLIAAGFVVPVTGLKAVIVGHPATKPCRSVIPWSGWIAIWPKQQILNRRQYPSARRQLETIRSKISALIQSLEHGEGTTSITFRELHSDGAMVRRQQLRCMMEKWKEAYHIVKEALAETQRQLTDLSRVLAANVFKAILKNSALRCSKLLILICVAVGWSEGWRGP